MTRVIVGLRRNWKINGIPVRIYAVLFFEHKKNVAPTIIVYSTLLCVRRCTKRVMSSSDTVRPSIGPVFYRTRFDWSEIINEGSYVGFRMKVENRIEKE